MKRMPFVAGSFYSANSDNLKKMIAGTVNREEEKKTAVCVIAPHAGYEFSGRVAGAVYSSVNIPNRCILLGPSHRAIKSKFAIMRKGSWVTPIGEIKIDSDLADILLRNSPLVKEDNDAHIQEHSIEVQLPFLKFIRPDISIVPLSHTYFAAYEDLVELGKAVASTIKESGKKILLAASTDMSHQVSQETAKQKDFLAINKILALDARGLYEIVKSEQISMCGFQATTTALIAAVELGATKAELIKYQTSGVVTGDYSSVVGYAGIRII